MGTKKVVLIVSLFLVALIGIVILVSTLDKSEVDDFSKHEKETVTFGDSSYVQNSTRNYLIFGLDSLDVFKTSGTYFNDNMCDFILILNIDEENRKYTMMEINRDSMVDVIQLNIKGQALKERAFEPIAYSFTQGDGTEKSCINVLNTVCELLYGIKIYYYLAMKMPAINLINNSVGGVTITLDEDQDLTAVDPSWTPGATIHLEGEMAEEFVRARKTVSDGTNVSRMRRQTQYLEAFIEQVALKQEDSSSTLLNAYLEASDYLLTSVDPYAIDELFNTFKDYEYQGTLTPTGRVEYNEKDNALFYIDKDSFDEIVKNLFFNKYEK